jgi:8-oxo-dGTP pyrophosphatase MutT (NUDIX family)
MPPGMVKPPCREAEEETGFRVRSPHQYAALRIQHSRMLSEQPGAVWHRVIRREQHDLTAFIREAERQDLG